MRGCTLVTTASAALFPEMKSGTGTDCESLGMLYYIERSCVVWASRSHCKGLLLGPGTAVSRIINDDRVAGNTVTGTAMVPYTTIGSKVCHMNTVSDGWAAVALTTLHCFTLFLAVCSVHVETYTFGLLTRKGTSSSSHKVLLISFAKISRNLCLLQK